MSDAVKKSRAPHTPKWDIRNPKSGEVDLIGAMRFAIQTLHDAGPLHEGVHFFITCPLQESLTNAGFDQGKAVLLSQLMQELGLIKRLTKQGDARQFRWWIVDASYIDMFIHPELIESAKNRYEVRSRQLEEIRTLTQQLDESNARIQALTAEALLTQTSAVSPVSSAESLPMTEVAELIADLDEERDRVNELEKRMLQYEAKIHDLEKQLQNRASSLAAQVAEIRRRRSGGNESSS